MVWTASSWGLPVSGPDAEVISAWSYAQVFTWILGIQTQVLMVQDQVLLPVSHPLAPPHPVNVFLFLSVYSLSLHLSCSFQGDRDPIFHGCHRHINFGTMIDTHQTVTKHTGALHSIWKLSNRKCQGLPFQSSCFWILGVMAYQGVAPRTLLIPWMEPSWCN